MVLCDDVADLRELIRLELEVEGDLEVVAEAGDGREVLRVVAEQRPDVLLLDLSMPELDGLEVLERLRAQHSDTRVVVLSGFTFDAMGDRAMQGGADRYVEKGAPGDVLRSVVRQAAAGVRAVPG